MNRPKGFGGFRAFGGGRPNARSASRFGLLRRGGGFHLGELASNASCGGLSNFGQFQNSPIAFGRNDRGEFWTTRFLRRM
jgi:hypothetical protein